MLCLLTNLGSGKIELCDLPAPELQTGGLLVQTAFSAVSAGTERSTLETARKSLLGKALARPDLVKQVIEHAGRNGFQAAYRKVQSRLESDSTLGYSCAGIVLKVGDGVTEFRPGDRVACAGAGYAAHREINLIPKNLAVKVPANVGLDAASLTTIGAIAVHGLRQSKVTFGETVAVIGAGLVGVLTILLARAAGCQVIAVDACPLRAKRAIDFGAHHCFEASDPVLKACPAADVAIITASSSSAQPLELSTRLLRDRGRIVVLGTVPLSIPRDAMYRKELSMVVSRSCGPGRYDAEYEEHGHDYPIGYVRWTERRNMEAFLDFVARGTLDLSPLIKNRCRFEDAPEAVARLEEKGDYTVILDYGHPSVAKVARPVAVAAEPKQSRLRIGCIGAGMFARSEVIPRLRQMPGTTLQSLGTASGISARSAQQAFGFQLLRQPTDVISATDTDAVFVLSRNDTHARYVLEAVTLGKPVFVEKPLAVNQRELASICEAYEAELDDGRSPFLMVGFNRRFSPASQQIRELFAHRREPMMAHIRVNAGYVPLNEWVQRPEQGGRLIGELCHFLDWARWLIGCRIESVYARASDNADRYNQDNVAVLASFADGSVANLLYVANGDRALGKEFYEIFCEGAVAQLNDFAILELIRDGKRRVRRCKRDKGHQRELELTVKAMREGTCSPIPFEEIVNVTEASFAVLDSLRSGLPVSVEDGISPVAETAQTQPCLESPA